MAHACCLCAVAVAFCGTLFGLRNKLWLMAADRCQSWMLLGNRKAPVLAPWPGHCSSAASYVAVLLVKAFPRKCMGHPIEVEVRDAIVHAKGFWCFARELGAGWVTGTGVSQPGEGERAGRGSGERERGRSQSRIHPFQPSQSRVLRVKAEMSTVQPRKN